MSPVVPLKPKNHGLVELIKLDPTIKLDIRYARTDNFVNRKVYPSARAFLLRHIADDLIRAHRSLEPKGLGLLVFDGYRPWSVSKLFWDVLPPEKHEFVADPDVGSCHNRGCAVDLTMYSRKTGSQVPMPSDFDETTERSYFAYAGCTPEEASMRALLREVMQAHGFTGIKNEWWHFNHKTFAEHPVLDLEFDVISAT